MKYLFYSILSLCTIYCSQAQITQPRISNPPNPFAACLPVTIQLQHYSTPAQMINQGTLRPFRKFTVIDERPDTARIGVHKDKHKAGHSFNRQLVLPGQTAIEITTWLNDNFASPEGTYDALVVLRSLWLSDANHTQEELARNHTLSLDKTIIRCKAEIYTASDSLFTPLFRFDSVMSSRKSSYGRFGNMLMDMLVSLADRATIVAGEKSRYEKQYRFEDICQYNQSRFEMAITREGKLRKGAYNSFQEFKDNAPSIQNCDIKSEEGKLLLYMKDARGNSSYSHTAWGYCDGTNIFIMRDGSLCPAWRAGNAWYIFGNMELEEPVYVTDRPSWPSATATGSSNLPANIQLAGLSANVLVHSLIGHTSTGREKIYLVDMDSGIQY